MVARHARDKDDLADLLGALGLPGGEGDLVRLLPHLTTPNDSPTGDPMPVNAFTATAASMLKNGDSPEHVRSTLGLSESELDEAGLAGVRLRRRHRTTVADPAAAKAPDLIGRDVTASEPNTKYVGDITYLCRSRTVPRQPRRRRRAYRSRRPVHEPGVRRRLPPGGRDPEHECRRQLGGQRARRGLQRHLQTGDSRGRRAWADEREARLDLFRWLHRYNTRRRHSSLGQRSPIAYETALDTTSTTLAPAA